MHSKVTLGVTKLGTHKIKFMPIFGKLQVKMIPEFLDFEHEFQYLENGQQCPWKSPGSIVVIVNRPLSSNKQPR